MRIEAYNVMNIGIGFKMPAYRNISNCKNDNRLVVVGDGNEGTTTCGFASKKQEVTLKGEDAKSGELICKGMQGCLYRKGFIEKLVAKGKIEK